MAKKPTRTATKSARSAKTPRLKKIPVVKTGIYMGLEFESFCEISCIYFAEEMIKLGYVSKIVRSPSYLLCDPVQHTYVEQMIKSSKQITQTISLGTSYTPDYDIYFTSKALGVFCWELGSTTKWEKHLLVVQNVNGLYRACCEVKPDFSRASTTPKSVQTMKWLMQRHGIYCNLFRPNRIFEGLFVPDKYRVTERGTQRLLKFTPLSINQYLGKLKTKANATSVSGLGKPTKPKRASKRNKSSV